MSGSHDDVSKHVKAYYAVFGALAVFTIITVAASRLNFGHTMGIIVALIIASIKAGLVAAIFMHLKWERGVSVWTTLAFCAAFFVVLMVLPIATISDLPKAAQVGMWDSLPDTGHVSTPGHH
jgi:cytochrome c oxidase subunit 4